jgi:hypothetical protein
MSDRIANFLLKRKTCRRQKIICKKKLTYVPCAALENREIRWCSVRKTPTTLIFNARLMADKQIKEAIVLKRLLSHGC